MLRVYKKKPRNRSVSVVHVFPAKETRCLIYCSFLAKKRQYYDVLKFLNSLAEKESFTVLTREPVNRHCVETEATSTTFGKTSAMKGHSKRDNLYT